MAWLGWAALAAARRLLLLWRARARDFFGALRARSRTVVWPSRNVQCLRRSLCAAESTPCRKHAHVIYMLHMPCTGGRYTWSRHVVEQRAYYLRWADNASKGQLPPSTIDSPSAAGDTHRRCIVGGSLQDLRRILLCRAFQLHQCAGKQSAELLTWHVGTAALRVSSSDCSGSCSLTAALSLAALLGVSAGAGCFLASFTASCCRARMLDAGRACLLA